MGHIIIVRVPGAGHAARVSAAASWAKASYAGLAVVLTDETVELTGPWDDAALHRLWRAALLNERLADEATTRRAQRLESLLA